MLFFINAHVYILMKECNQVQNVQSSCNFFTNISYHYYKERSWWKIMMENRLYFNEIQIFFVNIYSNIIINSNINFRKLKVTPYCVAKCFKLHINLKFTLFHCFILNVLKRLHSWIRCPNLTDFNMCETKFSMQISINIFTFLQ